MGHAPPAPSFAMLYYGVHEYFTLLPTFQDCLAFYGCYIDDGIGIWICDPDPALDATLWESFQAHTGFGKLVWDVSDRASTVNFLDMTITLLPSSRIKTRLYEKPLNLHLYLSPHSAHPPGLACVRTDPWGALPHPSTHLGSLGYLSGHP
jgi:hypothetical protein